MTTEPENAKRLHWERAEIRWEGTDEYMLDIPHYIDSWPAAWLHRNLDRRLREANPDWAALGATVSQATPTHKPNSVGWSDPGYITVFSLWLPFDGADKLRDAIEAAVEDAYAAANAAIKKADHILGALRRRDA
jgi:hypothetical protein